MPKMSDADRDAFVRDRRYGILTTLRADGAPVSVPVWLEWDGTTLRMFAHQASGKLKRLAKDARATVLVVNHPDEREKWVAFDGTVAVSNTGGLELGERVFDAYYPEGDSRRGVLKSWQDIAEEWRLLELKPTAIRFDTEE